MDTHYDNSMKQFNIDRFSTDKMKEIDDAMKMFNFDLTEGSDNITNNNNNKAQNLNNNCLLKKES